jgi:hypothetical protein
MGYRCYFLDQQGRIMGRAELPCADDTAASREAERLLTEGQYPAAELWHLGRKIAVLRGLPEPRNQP